VPSDEESHENCSSCNYGDNFELKPFLIQIVHHNQFSGNLTEDPNLHFVVFVQLTNTLKSDGVNPKAICLRLFPFFLKDRVRAWLQSLPSNSITTWNELKKAFLARYFPQSKMTHLGTKLPASGRWTVNIFLKHGRNIKS